MRRNAPRTSITSSPAIVLASAAKSAGRSARTRDELDRDLVPVLGRAQAIKPLVDSIKASTRTPWSVLFLCTPADSEAIAACFEQSMRYSNVSQQIVPWDAGPGDWARKINLGYSLTNEEFILLGATDLRFHPGWDEIALYAAATANAGVIGTNDLGNATVMRGHHSTHPLVRRSYIEVCGTIDEPDKVVHEGYQHQWVDTELCETAKARGEWAFARDSHVEHMHPFWTARAAARRRRWTPPTRRLSPLRARTIAFSPSAAPCGSVRVPDRASPFPDLSERGGSVTPHNQEGSSQWKRPSASLSPTTHCRPTASATPVASRARPRGRDPRHILTRGIAGGYVYKHKPEGFLLYGQKRTEFKDGQRFIYRQPNASVGFIVRA